MSITSTGERRQGRIEGGQRSEGRRPHGGDGWRNGRHEPRIFPGSAIFSFHARKRHYYPKGTEVTAYVNGDMKLDIAKFQSASPAPQSSISMAPNSTPSPASAKLQLESNPSGADIEIDGNFVGNTPSDLTIAEGEHTITVKKSGFKDWERKMKISSGSNVHLSAELEK